MTDAVPLHAVLTGDLIRSTRLSTAELESARERVLGAVDEVRGWRRGLIKSKAEFFRGDSWQALVVDPALALRAAVFIRASLLATGIADTRVAIGLGTVEKISSSRVSLSTGEAFARSGAALDRMAASPHGGGLAVALPESMTDRSRWVDAIATLVDALMRQWTPRQAALARLALAPDEPSHEAIGERTEPPVSRQAVAKSMAGARWDAVLEGVRAWEASSWTSNAPPQPN